MDGARANRLRQSLLGKRCKVTCRPCADRGGHGVAVWSCINVGSKEPGSPRQRSPGPAVGIPAPSAAVQAQEPTQRHGAPGALLQPQRGSGHGRRPVRKAQGRGRRRLRPGRTCLFRASRRMSGAGWTRKTTWGNVSCAKLGLTGWPVRERVGPRPHCDKSLLLPIRTVSHQPGYTDANHSRGRSGQPARH